MALTTTQINQAYLAILGRGAVGTESNVGANASVSSVAASLITAAAKDNSEMFTTLADRVLAEGNGLDNDTFVESLYTTFLNRGSDEEGKAYWLSALNSGMSRKDLVASVIDAIVSQKAANSQDYQNYVAQVTTQANDFVESLYQNLLGREADAEGKAYWISLIADGASYADIAANAAAAALAQGKDTIDGATVANRLEVADYATTNLTSFSKLTTAADIEAIKENLKQTIANITSNAESVAEYKTNIDSTANTYKAPGSVPFTTKEDNLGVDPNSGQFTTSKATDFKGTINLADAAKGTIQANDKVTGNTDFADGNILTVNVTGATKDAHTLNLTNQLPSTITDVKNLVINASTARVSGDISGDTFTKTVTIDAGYTNQTETFASDITVKNNLEIYNAGAKADKLTVSGGVSIDTAKMGAGNDTIVLQTAGGNEGIIANIDGGAGNDTLELATVASGDIATSGDYTPIKSINSVETIKLTGASDDTSGAQISYDAIKGNNKKFTLTTTTDGSGALTIKAGNNTDIDLSQITNGEKSGTSYNNKVASITLDGVKAGATIKLNPLAKDQGGTAETIKLAANAEKVTVNGVLPDDVLDLQGLTALSGVSVSGAGTSAFGVVTSSALATKKAYYFDSALTTDGDLMNSALVAEALTKATKGGTTSGDKTIIAVNNKAKDKSAIYLFTNDSNSDIKDTELTLLAVVDNAINGDDTMTAGSTNGGYITFA